MDEHQMRQVLHWFRSRVGDITCSVCGHGEFKFDPELTVLPVFRAGAPPDFAGGVPAVILYCSHCASVRLFSADKMGVTAGDGRGSHALPPDGHPADG